MSTKESDDRLSFRAIVARIPTGNLSPRVRDWLVDTFPLDPHVAVTELCQLVHDQLDDMAPQDREELLRIASVIGLDRVKTARQLGVPT